MFCAAQSLWSAAVPAAFHAILSICHCIYFAWIRVIRGQCLSSLVSIRVDWWLSDVDHQAQVEKQQRRGEKQTVQKIERAANSREQISRVLYVSAALDD